ncbi:MAG TPA: hypothetical protein VG942_16420 [Hyphomonadaceae bacterium]|nr:hypothetical protein [Hyphomonadaceae bacterium]
MIRARRRIAGLALMLAACAPGPSFEIAPLLSVRQEGKEVTLTGWVQTEGPFRLYPLEADIGKSGDKSCISGVLTSLAGVPPPTLNHKRMTVMGKLYPAGARDAANVKDECGNGIVLMVTDLSR